MEGNEVNIRNSGEMKVAGKENSTTRTIIEKEAQLFAFRNNN
jgi:hypothetical protein